MFVFYGGYIARFIQVKIEVRDVSELAVALVYGKYGFLVLTRRQRTKHIAGIVLHFSHYQV